MQIKFKRPSGCDIFMILILCLMGASCMANLYLRKDAEKIRKDLIKKYPIGSTMSEVENKIRARGIKPQVSHNAGFLKQEASESVVIGTQSIRAHIGDYRETPFLLTSVTAFWAFDERNNLIDIWVWKTTDGP